MFRCCYQVHREGIPRPCGVCRKPSLVRDSSRLIRARLTSLVTNSRFHKATAPSLIKHFRDCIKQAPRELYANVLLTAGPADQDSLVVIQMCYIGPKEKGVEYLNAISSWDGESCLLNEVNEKAFLNQQDSVAQVLRARGPCSHHCHLCTTILMRSSGSPRQPEGSGSSVRRLSLRFRMK